MTSTQNYSLFEMQEPLRTDPDLRETAIRRWVYEVLPQHGAAELQDHIIATYFIVAQGSTPAEIGREIAYHMTAGVRSAPEGSLLAQCCGKVVGSVDHPTEKNTGLVSVAFPLKLWLDADDALYSTSILHIVAGAGVFELTENMDAKLVNLEMSEESLRRFPGPAYGAPGIRHVTGLAPDEIAFGTILKPCSGITPSEEADIVAAAAANPMFMFVKEDENFMPLVRFAPLKERLRAAQKAIERVRDQRGGRGLIYAPHITAPPQQMAALIETVLEAGANGVMFSEYYAGGLTRLVRDQTAHLERPPVIYGHNGGITARTRAIWREVLDMLARLDGVDFRQTSALNHGPALLRPNGIEWEHCEAILSQPLAGHAPVMMARAGGLDQGNIILNLSDAERRGGTQNYLFLAGSAINGIKRDGHYDPALGAEAMRQAIEVFWERALDPFASDHVSQLKALAEKRGQSALSAALSQRYA
jgi:ribulose 1,5-bisphosphate carboxylase large subunit-like protein